MLQPLLADKACCETIASSWPVLREATDEATQQVSQETGGVNDSALPFEPQTGKSAKCRLRQTKIADKRRVAAEHTIYCWFVGSWPGAFPRFCPSPLGAWHWPRAHRLPPMLRANACRLSPEAFDLGLRAGSAQAASFGDLPLCTSHEEGLLRRLSSLRGTRPASLSSTQKAAVV